MYIDLFQIFNEFILFSIKYENNMPPKFSFTPFFKMAGSDRSMSLKEALIESLGSILSPDHDLRVSGEEQVKALEVTEG